MAIQDDFTIDKVDKKLTYTTAFVDGRPPNIYTANEFYSWLADVFDEPAYLNESVPMSAQTPTQYTMLYPWFIDNESTKAIYGGSIQTSSWAKSGANGITALRWTSATSAPTGADIGKAVAGVTSSAGGVILAVDTVRQIVWVRNTTSAQFQDGEVVDDDATGTDPDFTLETNNGFQSGENIWSNLFSVGSKGLQTEIYVGQEDDQLGGTNYHNSDSDTQAAARRMEKLAPWWDVDVDFFTGSPNLLGGAGHFDILVLTKEMGAEVDGQRLSGFAREFGRIYSHFDLVGGVGNFVVVFTSTGSDLNSADGPYLVGYDGNAGDAMVVGTILENDTGTTPVGRLRAVVTAVTGTASGDFDFYLIGDTEADGTLIQFANNDDIRSRSVTNSFAGAIDTVGQALTAQGPATVQGISVTFADAQADVDEDSSDEEYAATIDCNDVPLADVYKRMMFLAARGNQDGTVAGTPDTLLPGGGGVDEAGEFYRAVGDIVFSYDGGTGTQPTEGDLVVGSISGAYGVVTSITTGTTGTCVLTQVRGTFVDSDQIAEIDAAGGNYVVVDGTPIAITDNTGAPFGTFAGGRWFVAQGVLLTGVPAADANNWETVDLAGVRRAPPTQRSITFAGLVVNDRAAIFEVDTAGGTDITKNQNGVGAAGAALAATSIPLDSTVALDVPPDGMIRVVDDSSTTGEEYRYEYSSVSGTTVTLRTGAGLSGTTTSAGTATVLNDTGAFASFGTDGNVKVGHQIRKTVSGEWATVLRKIDDNSIETTPLTGAETWGNAIAWTANTVVVALVDADTVYFPFIDGVVATGTTLTSTIKYVADTECIARCRFSDPDVGGDRILPFELPNVQVLDADLTVTAIRTLDPIAS